MLACIAVVGLAGYSYYQDFGRSREVDREINALQEEVNQLRTRNVQIAELLQYFDSEGYAESRARLELGLVKPGEKVMVVPSATPGGDAVSDGGPSARLEQTEPSPPQAWWSYFFGRRTEAAL